MKRWLALLALPLLGACGYNRIQTLDEQANTAQSQIEVQLQRRADLIPNLVNTVKGYAQHEKGVLEEVTRLRSQWGEAKTTAEKADTANRLEGALGRLMVVVERYPDLKANQNFRALQDELAGTENRISVERRRYNEAVQGYNASIQRFPTNIVAGFGHFEAMPYFESKTEAKEAPKVDFSEPTTAPTQR
ncbi:MAG: LemA family protein [Verrucomicrobiae bacterium]|nr:LemA family protein [Verrucomicrobiae bacterium]